MIIVCFRILSPTSGLTLLTASVGNERANGQKNIVALTPAGWRPAEGGIISAEMSLDAALEVKWPVRENAESSSLLTTT